MEFGCPLPRQLISGVGHDAEVGDHVLNMGLFVESEPGTDIEGDAAPGQFQLQLNALEMGPVQHSHAIQWDALVPQLEHTLSNKGGLLFLIGERSERGLGSGRSNRSQDLVILVNVVNDAGVG